MDKRTAKNYDALLREMATKQQLGFRPETLWLTAEPLGMDAKELTEAISTFKVDGFIEHVKHPEVPHIDFGVFNISDKGIRFLVHEGGYQRKRRFENYAKTNIKFTWVRHWAWFYTALLSLLANLYFISRYLLEWL